MKRRIFLLLWFCSLLCTFGYAETGNSSKDFTTTSSGNPPSGFEFYFQADISRYCWIANWEDSIDETVNYGGNIFITLRFWNGHTGYFDGDRVVSELIRGLGGHPNVVETYLVSSESMTLVIWTKYLAPNSYVGIGVHGNGTIQFKII